MKPIPASYLANQPCKGTGSYSIVSYRDDGVYKTRYYCADGTVEEKE